MKGETPGLALDRAPADQRRHGAAPKAEPAGADQGERAAAFAEHRRDMAADQPAEGEAGEVEALAGREDAGDSVGGDGGETLRRMRPRRSEEHTSELQSHSDLVCRLLLEKKKT